MHPSGLIDGSYIKHSYQTFKLLLLLLGLWGFVYCLPFTVWRLDDGIAVHVPGFNLTVDG